MVLVEFSFILNNIQDNSLRYAAHTKPVQNSPETPKLSTEIERYTWYIVW